MKCCRFRLRPLCVLILLALHANAQSDSPHPAAARAARPFPEADRLFRQDPRWLGADAALSVRLSKGRTLWLFGDTFIAQSDDHVRSKSKMVRNTVAIQSGDDPRTALMTFSWLKDSDGSPGSFFPESGKAWYWPGHGIRIASGPLLIFLYKMAESPGKGLGFVCAGYALAIIDNPDDPASKWKPRIVQAPKAPFDAVPATAVIRDGDYVVALAIRQNGTHAGALVRYPVRSLAMGDVSRAEWWAGTKRGWLPTSALGPAGPSFVIKDAGAECSLHWSARAKSFVHIASYGFGASWIGLRTAPALTGPWSAPVMVYRPPESDAARPFVYAAKAHAELAGPNTGDLVVTYVANSFDPDDLFTKHGERHLYWPRSILVRTGGF